MRGLKKQLLDVFSRKPKETALVHQGSSYSYHDVYKHVSSFYHYAKSKGLEYQDVILVSASSRFDVFIWYLVSLLSGFVLVPVSSQASQYDKDRIANKVKPKLIIDSTLNCDPLVLVEDWPNLEDDDCMASIHFTSGTTAEPKGVCHSPRSLISCALAFNEHYQLTSDIKFAHVLPINYMAGFLNSILSPMLAGGTIYLCQEFNPISGLSFWPMIEREKINTLWVTPTMLNFFNRIGKNPEHSKNMAQTIKYLFVGTAPLLDHTRTQFENTYKVQCLENYGLSELLFVSGALSSDLTVGKPLNGVTVRTISQDGLTLDHLDGSIQVQTPFRMIGYYDENTQQPLIDKQDWFDTGDIGHIDGNERLKITARMKDIIIRGGVNLSPLKIESVLLNYPGVMEVCVLGREHDFWGEEVIAFVVCEALKKLEPHELKNHATHYLQPEEIPSQFYFIESLPKTQTGKYKKNELKALL